MSANAYNSNLAGSRLGLLGWLALMLAAPQLLWAAETVELQSMEDPASYASPTNGLGFWIWESETRDNQYCRLWKAFEIPAGSKVSKARLVITADNEFAPYLDGRELGRGVEWRQLYIFDLSPLLSQPGPHVLAVKCYNGEFHAGMLCGLRIELSDGRVVEAKSDASWKVVPEEENGWEKSTKAPANWAPATVIAPFGGDPWTKPPEAIIMMPSLQPIRIFFWQTGWFQASLSLLSLTIVLLSLWLLAQLVFHRKERGILEQERTRIARDIHDDMGGRLTQLVVHVEVAQNELPANSELRPQLDWVCSEIRGLLSTMDEVLWVVNPRCDTLTDFADYVSNYAHEFLQPAQIQCFFAVDPKLPAAEFPFPLRRSLLMAVKEALNNVLKHSGATELHLGIHWEKPTVTVTVRDNGKGFDLKRIESGRNGLINMTQRLNELDGTCHIMSRPGEGCRVEFKIPLKGALPSAWSRLWQPDWNKPANRGEGNRESKISQGVL